MKTVNREYLRVEGIQRIRFLRVEKSKLKYFELTPKVTRFFGLFIDSPELPAGFAADEDSSWYCPGTREWKNGTRYSNEQLEEMKQYTKKLGDWYYAAEVTVFFKNKNTENTKAYFNDDHSAEKWIDEVIEKEPSAFQLVEGHG